MDSLRNANLLLLGLGEQTLAMARWCARFGAQVQVWDSREAPPLAAALHEALPQARLFSGALDAQALAGISAVLKGPGLAPQDERIAPLLAAAREAGIPLRVELDLFVEALAALKAERGYAPQVLAITGTNGKTTTTALTALLVERAGRSVVAAGNIGPTMLDTLGRLLDLEGPPQAAPVEASAATMAPEPVFAAEEAAPVEVEAASPAADAAGAASGGAPDVEPADPPAGDDDAPPVPLPAPPPRAPVFEHLPQVWVLELSSFQLDGVSGFEPSAASVLNISQDHLDWHGSLAAYVQAKARVFGEHALMVINRDDPQVSALVPAPVLVKGARGKPARSVARAQSSFGLDAPRRPGDFGLVSEGGMAWLVRALPADETLRRRKDEEEEIHLQRLMPADALRIRGRHNAANALAALALASAIGCPLAPMLHGLREYRGEPHRVQPVGMVGGIEAFDDSKGTNVGATVAALEGLGTDVAPGRLLLILGGEGKGQDFSPLAAPVGRFARAVALIGRDAAAIEAALEAALATSGVPLQRHASLEEATAWCFAQARSGDAVLLSPACASLDMFRNYAHRAEVFVAAVHALASERGEVLP